MFEHVGKKKLGRYFAKINDVLEPDGALLNHGIVTRNRRQRRIGPDFINTYVFPDGELVTVDDVIAEAEDAGLELRDAESLRMSYAFTLHRWVENLEANHEAAVEAAGEIKYRTWRLYMAASAIGFDLARVSVYQLLLATPERPWTFGRSHLCAQDDR
jgi:cyclopropane-fatty-acyl-phospholipid synthase